MIEIGETHTILHDSQQWILVYHPKGRDEKLDKRGRKVLLGTRTYHGRLGGALDKIIDDSMKGAKTVAELAQQLVSAQAGVVHAAQEVEEAIYARQATGCARRAYRPPCRTGERTG